MHLAEGVARGVVWVALATAPIMAILNRIVVGSEIAEGTPKSLRQTWYLKGSELTPSGRRARTFFRYYWCTLGLVGAVLVVVLSLT